MWLCLEVKENQGPGSRIPLWRWKRPPRPEFFVAPGFSGRPRNGAKRRRGRGVTSGNLSRKSCWIRKEPRPLVGYGLNAMRN